MTLDQLLSWWSFIFLGVLVYVVGQWVKGTVRRDFPPTHWFRQVFDRTVVGHPPIVAALVAMIPGFPIPTNISDSSISRALFGFGAGVFCAWSYKLVIRGLEKDSAGKQARESRTNAAPEEGEA